MTACRRLAEPNSPPISTSVSPYPVRLLRSVIHTPPSRAGADAQVVVNHQVIVSVIVSLIELLRGEARSTSCVLPNRSATWRSTRRKTRWQRKRVSSRPAVLPGRFPLQRIGVTTCKQIRCGHPDKPDLKRLRLAESESWVRGTATQRTTNRPGSARSERHSARATGPDP